MIVVDTSAIMAILLAEDGFEKILEFLVENELCMSAGTYSELLIVAYARGFEDEVLEIIKAVNIEIISVDAYYSKAIKNAFKKWGKGRHVAKLNFGDCFAYALAKDKSLPLLFVGNDFSKTDIKVALR